MNSPDIRISTTLPRHRKFKKFKRFVGDAAMEYLVCLWCEVAEQAPTGELKGWKEEDIAEAACFQGNPKVLVEALVASGMLDACSGHWQVHDWQEHQEYVFRAPERIAKAKKAAAKRWGCYEHATSMLGAMPPSPPFPSPPLDTKSKAPASPPAPRETRRFVKPSPEEVTQYAQEIGFTLDGESFCDHYQAKDWKIGKSPMKDWKAAVRTWKKSAQDRGRQPAPLPFRDPNAPRRLAN